MKTNYLYDNIYGDIELSPLLQLFVNTKEFQRLRFLKQLGPAFFVYPTAETSRFSHSLGVCHLALTVCRHLQSLYPGIVTDRLIQLLSIAGLLHDIGHGPFSHTFDSFVESTYSPFKIHENRSKAILCYMVEKYKIALKDEEVQFICDTFTPSIEQQKIWKYQIISSDIDVDRIDYILRDSRATGVGVSTNLSMIHRMIRMMTINDDGQLMFHLKASNIVKGVLSSRKELFKTVYMHKRSRSIENVIKKIFDKVDEKYNLKKIIREENIEEFLKLDDSILQKIYFDNDLKDVKPLIDSIYNRTYTIEKKDWCYKKLNVDIMFNPKLETNTFKSI
jgi:HD superfamily phosphohydrolase